MAGSGSPSRGSKVTANTSATSANTDHDDHSPHPEAVSDALCRTAAETCHQRDRRARLIQIHAPLWELAAAEALVDTCDLALEEAITEFNKEGTDSPASDAVELRKTANALWLAARDYIRRMSIASRAARQIGQQHDADALSGLRMEYEFEASSLLALKQAVAAYLKLRPAANS